MMRFTADHAGQAPEINAEAQMNQQSADLPRFVQIIGRYRSLIGSLAVLGLLVGVVFAALNPPLFTSRAVVMYQPACPAGSICGGPEFAPAGIVVKSLPASAQVTPGAGNVVTVTATGGTAAQAEAAADAAARSLADAPSARYPGEQVSGLLVESATTAAGAQQQLFSDALRGMALGALLGILAALAGSRTTIDPMTAPRGFGAGEEDRATGRAGGGYAPTRDWLADLARESVERRTALDTSLGRSQADPP
jgi:hypothetical protein